VTGVTTPRVPRRSPRAASSRTILPVPETIIATQAQLTDMSTLERRCIGCEETEETARLERCVTCGRDFCGDCAYRATGRRFCSGECARAFFYGDEDDDENTEPADD